MIRYFRLFQEHSDYEAFRVSEDFLTPNVSECINGDDVHYNPYDFADEYLTIKALESGTIGLYIAKECPTSAVSSISYSLDGGATWTQKNNVYNTLVRENIPVNSGDEILFKGDAVRISTGSTVLNGSSRYGAFIQSTCRHSVRGNIMSLLYGDNFKEQTNLSGKTYAFSLLFYGDSGLVDASNLSLPATTLESYCYYSMFGSCSGLTLPPELPATTLAQYCYYNMFQGCTNLLTTPKLPALTMISSCYYGMFSGCRSLTVPPELPATTLASECYRGMFSNCVSLTKMPNLHAMSLSSYCYSHMFSNCTSLTYSVELPATTLAQNCYYEMFEGCTNLVNGPTILPATTLPEGSSFAGVYAYMFSGCTSLANAPILPATTLKTRCYYFMFGGCTSLTNAPELPATTLAVECYSGMFNNCTNLIASPSLPATELKTLCYANMFGNTNLLPDCSNIDFTSVSVVQSGGLRGLFRGTKVTDSDLMTILPLNGQNKYYLPVTQLSVYSYQNMFTDCTGLTTPPELPAITLTDNCYAYMFSNCTSLTTAPDLPATALVNGCYNYMFSGCTSLNYIKAMFTTTPSTTDTNNWVSGVAASGTFVKNSAAQWDVTGVNGIPTNWTVQTASS